MLPDSGPNDPAGLTKAAPNYEVALTPANWLPRSWDSQGCTQVERAALRGSASRRSRTRIALIPAAISLGERWRSIFRMQNRCPCRSRSVSLRLKFGTAVTSTAGSFD
jgi:hypothetical protein